jgi:hypothetical protein
MGRPARSAMVSSLGVVMEDNNMSTIENSEQPLTVKEELQPQQLSPEQIERVFELVKMDYARLGVQEQSIMDARLQIWVIFFGITAGPTGYASVVGLRGSVFVLALVPVFITCLALHVKHSEMVLRHDIRKNLKAIARTWGYQNNHDSAFSKQKQKERRRWWHGWYRLAMGALFTIVEIVIAAFLCWYFNANSLQALGIAVAAIDVVLIAITSLCLLF